MRYDTCPRQPGPACHLHCRRLHRGRRPVNGAASIPPGGQHRQEEQARNHRPGKLITPSDLRMNANRRPARLLRAGWPQAEARRSGGSPYLLPWSSAHSRQAAGSPAPRPQRHLNPRVTGGLREQGRPAPRQPRFPVGGRGRDQHAVRGQPVDHVVDVHGPGERERPGLRACEGRVRRQGYRMMTVQLLSHLNPRCAARQPPSRGPPRPPRTAGAGPVRPPSRPLCSCLSRSPRASRRPGAPSRSPGWPVPGRTSAMQSRRTRRQLTHPVAVSLRRARRARGRLRSAPPAPRASSRPARRR